VAETIEQQEHIIGTRTTAHRSRSGFWFGIIIVLIIISLAGAGFYLFTQLRDRQEDLGGEVKGQMSKQIADYQEQLVAIQNQLAALETNIGNKDSHFTKTLADFSALHNEKLDSAKKELNESVQRIQRQLGKTRGDWLIADAEYLLSIANERLNLIGDINTTREALEAADQRLRESGDTGVLKVREQIAKDLATLRAIQSPDIVGIYAAIQSQEAQVDKLTLILPYVGKPLEASSEKKHPEQQLDDPENTGLIDSALSHLEDIVTIKHTDQAVTEILTPEQADFIREQLRVKLELSKIALVERNEAIFQSGIVDAMQWIAQHFAKNAASAAMTSELDRLVKMQIHTQFPDMAQSIKLLRDITKLRLESDKALTTEGNSQANQSATPIAQPKDLKSEKSPVPELNTPSIQDKPEEQ
jgi:uncharacterized protein HemX